VIPVRNEADWIERCLGAVFRQDYPADRIEVIVADGMSTDGTYEWLEDFAKAEPRLRVLRNPARIVPSSLNLAINAARGEVIARIDGHTLVAPDYISTGIDALRRTRGDNVGGPMVKIGGGPVGDAISVAMSSRFGIGSQFQFAREEVQTDTVYLGMWPRAVFDRVGMFDEELVRNQDDEFNYRIRKHGGRIILSPAMRSRYQNRQSWRKLGRQFFEYGVWKARVLQKHPRQMSVRHFVPPAFDLGVLLGLMLSPIWGPALPLVAGAVCAYVAVIGAVALRHTRTPGAWARLCLALAVIHHAWGIGFLVGMVRFGPRWFKPERNERMPDWQSATRNALEEESKP
jgi:glycosyltransferase involved in cell wall biosynthesis